ncbi:hypothetical protein HPB47_013001 [Ixodes persulcatus]|uniref:Uncharacterized protein n=1 Tax=Ixodes persulcatus TaxID=34615 RepID=A0AC60NRY7_IXOPE|nr:hypothetical protein HPB47_013001 [Ixodes persulcatus]
MDCNAALASEFELPFSDPTLTEREYVCGGLRHHLTETAQPISLSVRRIVKFCTEEEMGNHSGCCDDPNVPEDKKGEVTLRNCSLSWSKHENNKIVAALNNVNLEVRPGSLIGVVGFVGSGKSSLLAGILGDMHVSGGAIKCTGRVAYVPQIANVHNMSVRDNILYGKPFNDVDYAGVLSACQLHEDIGTFPAGDLTEVGEKGETLSGGQKQRISLARAAYNRADVYLLDDPLSALDAVVAKKVFTEVIGNKGILQNKSSWQLIRALVRMGGPCIGLGLATFAVSAVALGWQLSWIKQWTQVEVGAVTVDPQEPSWIPILAAICTIDVLTRVLGSVLLAMAMRRLSSLLHSEMLSAVLSSPVSFFGSTPRGRIVNRFSVDLDHMDSRLYLSGKQFLLHTLFAFSRLRLGVRAARPAKFLEAMHTSRMMSHVTETMDSLSSIRAYGVLDRFCAHFCRLVDVNMRAYWTYCCLYRYARLVTFFCGFLVVLCTLLLTVLLPREDLPPDPSALGLSISAAMPTECFESTDALLRSDKKFVANYRLTKGATVWLCEQLRPHLQPDCTTVRVITVEQQVLCAMQFYAAGGLKGTVASDEHLAVHQSTVSRALHTVPTAIVECLADLWIRFPSTENARVKECPPAQAAVLTRGTHTGISEIFLIHLFFPSRTFYVEAAVLSAVLSVDSVAARTNIRFANI